MNGPEHYRLAEKCMSSVVDDDSMSLALLAESQVHAVLALTAATALGMAGPDVVSTHEYEAWEQVAATSPGLSYAEATRVTVAEQWQPRVDNLSALLVRAVRELADSGSPGQNRLAAELARDGGIEL